MSKQKDPDDKILDGTGDAGSTDAGSTDAGSPGAGSPDAVSSETESPDTDSAAGANDSAESTTEAPAASDNDAKPNALQQAVLDAAKAASQEAAEPASPAAPAEPVPSAAAQATTAAQPVPPLQAAAPQPAPAARASATPIAWIALVLVILVAVGGFNMLTDMQRREGLLLQRVQGLESVSGQDDTTFDQMRDNLQRQIELEIEGMAARQQRMAEDQQRNVSRLETLASDASAQTRRELRTELDALRGELAQQRDAMLTQQALINDLSVEDRESWQLAEVQYLLRLANQRLIMTGDTMSSEALLRSADNILRELDDADLMDLRAAVASDLAAVRAVPRLDVQGLYLRLDALIRQTDALVMFQLPERQPVEALPEAEDWQQRLSQGYDLALAKLSEYIVVSRRDVPVETLMDPQYEGLVRQNMRMLLEQAQVAMLSGNELLFRQSLERAQGWVSQFFKSDEQAALAMSEELRLIQDERVSVTLPDLSASLQALDAAMKLRLSRDGA